MCDLNLIKKTRHGVYLYPGDPLGSPMDERKQRWVWKDRDVRANPPDCCLHLGLHLDHNHSTFLRIRSLRTWNVRIEVRIFDNSSHFIKKHQPPPPTNTYSRSISSTFYTHIFFYKILLPKISSPKHSFVIFCAKISYE